MLIETQNAVTGENIYIDVDMVFSWGYNSKSRATHVVSNAGAILPVTATVDEIKQAKERKSDDSTKRPTN